MILLSNHTTINITGLYPSTDYNLYCTSRNIISNAKLFERDIINTMVVAKTACCRPIYIDPAGSTWTIESIYAKNFIRIMIDYIPPNENHEIELILELNSSSNGYCHYS